eukprot:Gb_32446 [translate_table: standard]
MTFLPDVLRGPPPTADQTLFDVHFGSNREIICESLQHFEFVKVIDATKNVLRPSILSSLESFGCRQECSLIVVWSPSFGRLWMLRMKVQQALCVYQNEIKVAILFCSPLGIGA